MSFIFQVQATRDVCAARAASLASSYLADGAVLTSFVVTQGRTFGQTCAWPLEETMDILVSVASGRTQVKIFSFVMLEVFPGSHGSCIRRTAPRTVCSQMTVLNNPVKPAHLDSL